MQRLLRHLRLRATAAVLATTALNLAGCGALGFGGATIESYRRSSTKTVEPEYAGLTGKKWAVIVSVDRVIQGEHPDLVLYMTEQMTSRISKANDTVAAAGYIPSDKLLSYLWDHPAWVTKPRGDLAKELGVDRLIVVEILEYRLNDPGNQYLWAGIASGTVGVIEADSPAPDEYAFQKSVRVKFPDNQGTTQAEMPTQMVNSVLAQRFVDRASWLFYRHEEPYYPKY